MTWFHGIERVPKNPTRRSPLGLTQTPVRSSRRAVPTTASEAARPPTAPVQVPAATMITVAKSMNAPSRSSRAAMATRQGPGR